MSEQVIIPMERYESLKALEKQNCKIDEREYRRDDTIFIDGVELYPVPDHPGFYADIESGKIYNSHTNKILAEGSQGSKRTGYVYISMKDSKGNNSPMSEHWAVFTAYMGVPKEFYINKGMTLHHITGDKSDNSYFNLMPVLHKHQYRDKDTKDRLKQRTNKRLTDADKDTLEAAWELLDEPKRSDFVNEWSDKLDIHWRTLDNFVKKQFIDGESIG